MKKIEIKIAHCADIHIGSKTNSTEILESFYNFLRVSKQENVQIILISGDLFDNFNISENNLNLVKEELKKTNIRTFISPGNHDPYTSDSVYNITKWPDNIYIFNNKKLNFIEIPEFSTRIYGSGFNSIYESKGLFKLDNILDDNYINICIMHGDMLGSQENLYNYISIDDIKNSNFDYVALGHIHKRTEIQKIGNTWCAYAGSMMSTGFDELGAKGAYIGKISKNICDLKFTKTCVRTYEKISIDISLSKNYDEIAHKIIEKISKFDNYNKNYYQIYITGELNEDFFINTKHLEQILKSELFFVKIIDNTYLKIDIEKLKYKNDLKGMFVRKALEKIEKVTSEYDKNIIKNALKIGIKAFSEEVFYNEN